MAPEKAVAAAVKPRKLLAPRLARGPPPRSIPVIAMPLPASILSRMLPSRLIVFPIALVR